MSLPPELAPRLRPPPPALDPVAEPGDHERGLNGCATIVGGWILCAGGIGLSGLDNPLLSGLAMLGPPAVAMGVNRFQTAVRRGRRRIQRWARIAVDAGWTAQDAGRDAVTLIAPDGARVQLTADPVAQARVAARAAVPEGHQLADVRLDRALDGPQPAGDPAFDAQVGVDGEAGTWLGLWDAPTRERLAQAAHGAGLSVEAGQVVQETRYVPFGDPQAVMARLEAWADLARSLVYAPADRADRLLARVRDDAGLVRLAAFQALRAEWPRGSQTAEARRVLRAAAEAGDAIGAPVGVALGDAALAVQALPNAAPDTQRWAVAKLVKQWPADEVAPALLDSPAPAAQGAAVRQLGRRGVPVPSARLVALAGRGGDAAAGVLAYAQATPTRTDEPVWIALLASEHGPARRAALDALAEAGGPAAVPALMAAEGDPELGPLATRALTTIRARLAGLANAGRLAVADGEAGGLALIRADVGGLAPAEEAAP